MRMARAALMFSFKGAGTIVNEEERLLHSEEIIRGTKNRSNRIPLVLEEGTVSKGKYTEIRLFVLPERRFCFRLLTPHPVYWGQ